MTRALHDSVDVALDVLIERERPACGQCRARQQIQRERYIEAGAANEIKAGERRDQHHQNDARLGQFEVIAHAAAGKRQRGFGDRYFGVHAVTWRSTMRELARDSVACERFGIPRMRYARRVSVRLVARTAAPTATWLVVGITMRPLQIVIAPRQICATSSRNS